VNLKYSLKIIKSVKLLLLVLPVILGLFFFAPQTGFGDKEGCHMLHSCPSDSSSSRYICGDFGYHHYCNNGISSRPTPFETETMSTENISIKFNLYDKEILGGWIMMNGKADIIVESRIKQFYLSDDLEHGKVFGKTYDNHTFLIVWDFDKSYSVFAKIWTSNETLRINEDRVWFK